MDSFNKTPRFLYNPSPGSEPEEDSFSGILEIHVHHARNIHNICIYDNQDVYAKFSLTYNPDQTFATRTVNGGGKNPDFNQDLIMKVNQHDAVLKCEIWMMSRAKNYMEDQLLGFALVPICSVLGKGKITRDYDLSSTDLMHSPAGTIRLSLFLDAKKIPVSVSFADRSVVDDSSAELLLDKKIPEEYCRIEFPDINVVSENQQMVSEYFAENGVLLKPWLEKPDGSFLHLGAAPVGAVHDYEMTTSNPVEYRAESVSPDNSGFMSSTMTSLSDDRNSADSMDKKSVIFTEFSCENTTSSSIVAETPTSKKEDESLEENGRKLSRKEEGISKNVNLVRNMKIDAEESAMQQQIVDMYMRSMQQFTESLAKMKLPMNLDHKPQGDDDDNDDDKGDLIQNPDNKEEIEKKKKDNSRVFYGSRAFF